ncbi:MAG: alpha-L-fucosidase, partial [Propionibacteriaceae bacterium]
MPQRARRTGPDQLSGRGPTWLDATMAMQEWYGRAKLGIFLHWGIYAVNSTSESWAFYLGECSWDDYYAQAAGF